VLRRWNSETRKFAFVKLVDKGRITMTVKHFSVWTIFMKPCCLEFAFNSTVPLKSERFVFFLSFLYFSLANFISWISFLSLTFSVVLLIPVYFHVGFYWQNVDFFADLCCLSVSRTFDVDGPLNFTFCYCGKSFVSICCFPCPFHLLIEFRCKDCSVTLREKDYFVTLRWNRDKQESLKLRRTSKSHLWIIRHRSKVKARTCALKR